MAEASIATLVFGVLIYFSWDRLHALLDRERDLDELGPESWYWRKLKFVPRLAAWLTRRLQHGALPGYLLTLAGTVTLMLLAALLVAGAEPARPSSVPLPLPVVGCALLIAGGALAAVLVRNHLVVLPVSELPLSTVILFDLGVYPAVWGAVGGFCLSLLAAVEVER